MLKNNNYGSHTTARSLPESETGILPNSQMYLHLPSDFAKKALFYAPYVGHFYCKKSYAVHRDRYDYYLFLLIDSGEMEVRFCNQSFIAGPQEIVLIDCKQSHSYRAIGDVSFRYFHFDGNSSSIFHEVLTKRYGYLIRTEKHIIIDNAMNTLLNLAYDGLTNECIISSQIHIILSELAMQGSYKGNLQDNAVPKAIAYLEKHFTDAITVKQLADIVNLSPFYFSRLFRKYTNTSPHVYQVRLKVTLARQLLASSAQSIEHIGENCGFNSPQHFIRCFKQYVGCTPHQYRKNTRFTGNY